MLQDLKNACRALLKTPWFTCITVLTLALAIGANTAIFGVVNRLLLNPLPYPDADRLVYLRLATPRVPPGMSASAYVVGAWREQARSFERIEGFAWRDLLAYDDNGARILHGGKITPGLPDMLGVAPLLGRGFVAADAEPGAPAAAVLSYEMWQRDYGGARDAIGRTLTLDELPYVVVGVMPPRWDAFTRGGRPEVWLPQGLPASPAEYQSVEALGRLRPGVSLEAATAELDAIYTSVSAQTGIARPMFGDGAITAHAELPSGRLNTNAREALLVLLSAVGLVLLVSCSNVANLLLARGASRGRELALRSALGASTWRLVRALFAECVVLALAAGAVGVGFGWLTLQILVRLRPSSLSMLGEAQLDPAVLAFTFGVSIATALLFGCAPAVQLASRKLGDALRHGASGVVRGGAGPRVRKLLVAAQMAISVVLLVCAGLLIRSVVELQSIDLGFDTRNLFSAELKMPRARYETPVSRDVLAEQLLERIRSSPGVAAATQAVLAPPGTITVIGLKLGISGVTLSDADAQGPRTESSVRPDYFSTLGIRLLEGRTFTADESRSESAVIVNRAAAQHYWPDGRALGTEVSAGTRSATVVGVVDNVVTGSLMRSRDTPQFYWPYRADNVQNPTGAPTVVLLVRAAEDPAVAIASVRDAVRALDPEIAITNLLMTETALANTIDAPRFNMALLTAFALIALTLAVVGLAAVVGYEVTERTHEIGIRMAFGARTADVRRLAMRHGLAPAFVGVVIGLIGALGATQLVATMLYGVEPRDPETFIGVVALLLLVAFGASWLPATRATRVVPMIALRAD